MLRCLVPHYSYSGPVLSAADVLCVAIPKERTYAALWLREQSIRVVLELHAGASYASAMERHASPALAAILGGKLVEATDVV